MTTFRILITLCISFLLILGGKRSADSRSASDLSAQTPEQKNNCSPASSLLGIDCKLPSPSGVVKMINEREGLQLQEVWRWLGFKENEASFSFSCRGRSCRAEQLDLMFDDEDCCDISLVRVSYAMSEYRYLFFKFLPRNAEGKQLWRFLGYFDSVDQRYKTPELRLVRGEGKEWIVLRELWGRGSGFSLYGERWFKLTEKGPKEVLSYPVSGHEAPWPQGLGRSIKSWIICQEPVNGVDAVKVQFSVAYEALDYIKGEELYLFTRSQKALYVWSESAERFVPDPVATGLSEKDIEAEYGFAGEDDELLEYNYQEFYNLAMSGNHNQKVWLREFLGQLEDTPEKLALLNLLRR